MIYILLYGYIRICTDIIYIYYCTDSSVHNNTEDLYNLIGVIGDRKMKSYRFWENQYLLQVLCTGMQLRSNYSKRPSGKILRNSAKIIPLLLMIMDLSLSLVFIFFFSSSFSSTFFVFLLLIFIHYLLNKSCIMSLYFPSNL